jgi:Fem-1 family protein b
MKMEQNSNRVKIILDADSTMLWTITSAVYIFSVYSTKAQYSKDIHCKFTKQYMTPEFMKVSLCCICVNSITPFDDFHTSDICSFPNTLVTNLLLYLGVEVSPVEEKVPFILLLSTIAPPVIF